MTPATAPDTSPSGETRLPPARPVAVTSTMPTPGTLADAAFENADYRDEFVVRSATSHHTVDDFARAYFRAQPRWLTVVSSGVWSATKLEELLGSHNFEAGTAVGSWKVYDRTDDEIMFGDNMGFMEYRFSMRLDPADNNQVHASTSVRYLWKRTGKFYFALAKIGHLRFVPMALRNAAKGSKR